MTVKDHKQTNLSIIRYPPKYPKSVHLYITNECNLDCKRCYYRTSTDSLHRLSIDQIRNFYKEWREYGLTSIAIGGGEPLLHPDIIEIVKLGKKMGFFMAVTTNGTIFKPIKPDRVHISYDELHPTWKREKLIQGTIDYYSGLGCKIGINHIVRSLENLTYIEEAFDNVDNVLLIREKPKSSFIQWNSVPFRKHYWIEGCMKNSICEQGILSFHVNYNSQASICSNYKKSIPYTTFPETWHKLKEFRCEMRDITQKQYKDGLKLKI